MRSAVYLAILALAITPSIVAAQAFDRSGSAALPTAPLTVEDAVGAALVQHPLVEAARARLQSMRSERAALAVPVNPTATLWIENAGYPGQPPQSDSNRETSLYMTFPIESFFQQRPRVQRAQEDVEAAEAALHWARRTVAAETIRTFFDVALAQLLLEEAGQNRERLRQLIAYNRARVGEGVTAEGELLRLQVELERTENELVLAEVALIRTKARLAPYLDEQSRNNLLAITVAVAGPRDLALSSLPGLELLRATAKTSRPDIRALRARVRSAAAAAQLERSMAVRQLGATLGNKRTGTVNTMVAGLSVTVPIFNLNGANVARATNEKLAIEQELEWAERSAAAEVDGAHTVAARLTAQLRGLRDSFVARAEDSHRLTLAAYREEAATLLQVLDAARMLADARLTYSRTLFAQRESLFNLALAIGSEPTEAGNLVRAWSSAATQASRAGGGP